MSKVSKVSTFLKNNKPLSFGAVSDHDVFYFYRDRIKDFMSDSTFEKTLAYGRAIIANQQNSEYNEDGKDIATKNKEAIALVQFVETCKNNSLSDKRIALFNEDGKAWLDRYDKLAKQRTEVSSTNVNVEAKVMTTDEAEDILRKAGINPNAIK